MRKTLVIDDNSIGVGNVIYFIAYSIKRFHCNDIILYHMNDIISDCKELFNFDVEYGEPEEYDLKFSDIKYNEFLNPKNCDFDKLRTIVNWEKVNNISLPFPDEYCVINMRFGDYITDKRKRVYKTINRKWLDDVLVKYEILEKFKSIVVVTDDIKLSKYTAGRNKDRFIYSHKTPLYDLCILLRASLIIGSCSTFSFSGFMLNKNRAKMIVEYPYYQFPNPYKFDENLQSELYDVEGIIKEQYKPNETPIVSICAMIKDEQQYLDEWIKWHIKIGFDKIFLFEDIGSNPHDEICNKYNQVHLLKVNDIDLSNYNTMCHGSFRQQWVYRYFLDRYRNETDWVLFIDADEYLQFEKGYNLKEFLKEYDRYNGVFIYWKIIGWSEQTKKNNNEVVSRFKKEGKLLKGDEAWDYKSFVNFNYADSTLETIHKVGNGVNTAKLSTIKVRCFKKCWLNHYFTKSWEEWLTQIFKRGDTFSAHRSVSDFFETNMIDKQQQNKLMGDLLNLGGSVEKKLNCFISNGVPSVEQQKQINKYRKMFPDYELKIWDNKVLNKIPKNVLEHFKGENDNGVLMDYIRSFIVYNYGGVFFDVNLFLKKELEICEGENTWFLFCKKTRKVIACGGNKGNLIDEKNMYYIEKKIKDNENAESQIPYVLALLFGCTDYNSRHHFFGVSMIPISRD